MAIANGQPPAHSGPGIASRRPQSWRLLFFVATSLKERNQIGNYPELEKTMKTRLTILCGIFLLATCAAGVQGQQPMPVPSPAVAAPPQQPSPPPRPAAAPQ